MPLPGKDLIANLDKLKTFADPAIVDAMGIAQTLVVNHAKANHERRPPGPGHPSARYYDVTAKLTNSIRQGEVEVFMDSIVGTVQAGGGLVDYAKGIETGTATHRAYPFMLPALEETHGQVLTVLGNGVRKALG